MIRRRARTLLAALATVLALVTGCTTTVAGTGRQAVRGPAQVTSAVQLYPLLMAVPEGAEPGTGEWAENRTPTVAEFAATIYSAGGADGESYLRALGLRAVAHRSWTTSAGNGADMYLLLFDPARNPLEWYTSEADVAKEQGLDPVASKVSPTVGFAFPDRTEDGQRVTRFFGYRGTIGVLVDYFVEGKEIFDPTDIDAWLTTQYGRLD